MLDTEKAAGHALEMASWTQQYDPCGNIFLSALMAAVPIFVL